MTIPNYQSLMLPVLRCVADEEKTVAEVAEIIAEQLGLSDNDRRELLKSGRQRLLDNVVDWSRFYMAKAGLVEFRPPAKFIASGAGLALLATDPVEIDLQNLHAYPAFQEFYKNQNKASIRRSIFNLKIWLSEIGMQLGGLSILICIGIMVAAVWTPSNNEPDTRAATTSLTRPVSSAKSAPSSVIEASGSSQSPSQFDACLANKSTNVEFAQCGSEEIARQESRLAVAWRNSFSCFNNPEGDAESFTQAKQKFLESQRQWIKWKDIACDFYATGAYGREGQVLSYAACQAQIVSQRVAWLDGFANRGAKNPDEMCR